MFNANTLFCLFEGALNSKKSADNGPGPNCQIQTEKNDHDKKPKMASQKEGVYEAISGWRDEEV